MKGLRNTDDGKRNNKKRLISRFVFRSFACEFKDAWRFSLVPLIRLRAGLRTRIDEAVLKVGHKYKLHSRDYLENRAWNPLIGTAAIAHFCLSLHSSKIALLITYWDGERWSFTNCKCGDWETNFLKFILFFELIKICVWSGIIY